MKRSNTTSGLAKNVVVNVVVFTKMPPLQIQRCSPKHRCCIDVVETLFYSSDKKIFFFFSLAIAFFFTILAFSFLGVTIQLVSSHILIYFYCFQSGHSSCLYFNILYSKLKLHSGLNLLFLIFHHIKIFYDNSTIYLL